MEKAADYVGTKWSRLQMLGAVLGKKVAGKSAVSDLKCEVLVFSPKKFAPYVIMEYLDSPSIELSFSLEQDSCNLSCTRRVQCC